MFIDPYRWQTVRILSVIHESTDAVTLVTERPPDYTFEPGQHAIVRVTLEDGTTRLRQYSFAQSPLITNLHFTITRSPGGEVSTWCIDTATTKSTLDISQAFTGPLHTSLTTIGNIGMIGGGSGIVPLMAHLRHMREQHSEQPITLIYSTRSNDQCYKDELQPISPHEQLLVRLTDQSKRFTNDEIISSVRDCDVVLVCGSRKFVTSIQECIHEKLPNKLVLAEAFSLQ